MSRKRWRNDPLTNRLLGIAKIYNLPPGDPACHDYINLSCSHTEDVAAQIHVFLDNLNGRALVIGNACNKCPSVSLQQILEYDRLSGDSGTNKAWLRSEGKVFGHRKPAKVFFLPNEMLEMSDRTASWKSVKRLFAYAVDR